MFKNVCLAACVAALAAGPVFAEDTEEAVDPALEYFEEVTMSNLSGVALQISCNAQVCKVHSQQPGVDVWDREEIKPQGAAVFDGLVTKYTGLGYY